MNPNPDPINNGNNKNDSDAISSLQNNNKNEKSKNSQISSENKLFSTETSLDNFPSCLFEFSEKQLNLSELDRQQNIKEKTIIFSRKIEVIEEEKIGSTSDFGNEEQKSMVSNVALTSSAIKLKIPGANNVEQNVDSFKTKNQTRLYLTDEDLKNIILKKPLPPNYQFPKCISRIEFTPLIMKNRQIASNNDEYPFDSGLKCNIF